MHKVDVDGNVVVVSLIQVAASVFVFDLFFHQ